ncbi:hypothetical protein [Actinomycetospora flava]|uniref:Uncharacterized protein n=1 Tax=Actinomycetospora flava TaxID=3129232 RepID=A0ABU8M2W9_9PSEU
MTTSWILLIVCVGLGVGFYALGVWVLRRGQGLRGALLDRRLLGLLVGSLVFGVFAYVVNQSTAQTTLYEVAVETGGVPVTQPFAMTVEHPGAEHTILVDLDAPSQVAGAAEFEIRVVDATGRVLAEGPRSTPWECRGDSACAFGGYYEYVTPGVGGALTVTITVLTPGIDVLHVAVFDEDKTDGERMPGY